MSSLRVAVDYGEENEIFRDIVELDDLRRQAADRFQVSIFHPGPSTDAEKQFDFYEGSMRLSATYWHGLRTANRPPQGEVMVELREMEGAPPPDDVCLMVPDSTASLPKRQRSEGAIAVVEGADAKRLREENDETRKQNEQPRTFKLEVESDERYVGWLQVRAEVGATNFSTDDIKGKILKTPHAQRDSAVPPAVLAVAMYHSSRRPTFEFELLAEATAAGTQQAESVVPAISGLPCQARRKCLDHHTQVQMSSRCGTCTRSSSAT
jgi:hypothetical protein